MSEIEQSPIIPIKTALIIGNEAETHCGTNLSKSNAVKFFMFVSFLRYTQKYDHRNYYCHSNYWHKRPLNLIFIIKHFDSCPKNEQQTNHKQANNQKFENVVHVSNKIGYIFKKLFQNVSPK